MVVWTSTLTSFELLGIAPTTAPVVKSHVNVLWAVAITLSGSLACSVLERTEVYFQRKGRLQARQLAHSPPLASATEGRGDAAAATMQRTLAYIEFSNLMQVGRREHNGRNGRNGRNRLSRVYRHARLATSATSLAAAEAFVVAHGRSGSKPLASVRSDRSDRYTSLRRAGDARLGRGVRVDRRRHRRVPLPWRHAHAARRAGELLGRDRPDVSLSWLPHLHGGR